MLKKTFVDITLKLADHIRVSIQIGELMSEQLLWNLAYSLDISQK